VQVLPGVAQPANVRAVYPARLAASAKVRVSTVRRTYSAAWPGRSCSVSTSAASRPSYRQATLPRRVAK